MKRRSFEVRPHESGMRLATFLSQTLAESLDVASRLIQNGAVYLAGRRCTDPTALLSQGQKVMAVLEERGSSAAAQVSTAGLEKLRVLYEDEALIAIDKPPGLLSQPGAARTGQSALDLVSTRLGASAGLVHRLDKETSGVLIFAKTPADTRALTQAFREGTVKKKYLAVCGPRLPAEGTVDLPLSKDPSRPGRRRASQHAHGAPARTDFRRLHREQDFALVLLQPWTGRTHQLRAHLRALDAPIIGDSLYGGAKEAAEIHARRCLLHAFTLEVAHPRTAAVLRISAPIPADIEAFFRHARTPILEPFTVDR